MRNKLLIIMIAVAVLLSVGVNSFADDSQDATANDSVTAAYTTGTTTVLMLGLTGEDGVSLSTTVGAWGASAPGEQAASGTTTFDETTAGASGYLVYTAHGVPASKITVSSASAAYNDGALRVHVTAIGSGGGGNAGDIQGTWASAGAYVDVEKTTTGSADLITGIDGVDTYTGSTISTDGAPLQYQLLNEPGLAVVDILFTILAE